MSSIFHNPGAFAPMREPLAWRRDASAQVRGEVHGVVLQCSADSQSAGHPLGAVLADQWIVMVPCCEALAGQIATGDTLERLESGETLDVQRVVRDGSDWILTCTAGERSPAP